MKFVENFKKQFKFKNYINYIVIVVFLIIMIVLGQNGALKRSMLGLLPRIAYCIIAAVSLNLVVGFLGELSLGHAGFMCIGAYIGCYCANQLHSVINSPLLVFIIAMLIGGLTAAFFGFLVGLPALRLKGDYLAIVTLAFGEIVRNIFMNLQVFGAATGLITKTYNTKTLYIIAFIVVLIVLILTQNLIRSKHGRAITAIRDNEIAAKAMGINVTFYKLFVFVVSAFFAGIAGVIMGHNISPILSTAFSYNFSIEILVMVVLGGIGSINGSIIAASLITCVNFILQDKLGGDLAAIRGIVYALILIVVILFNNAPILRSFVDRFNISALISKLSKKKTDPSDVTDDGRAWHRIESKIKMDELLSVDIRENDANAVNEDDKGGAE